MKLTKTAIDVMRYEGKPPKGKDVRWDDELPGFGVRVFPSGAKTFVISYRAAGRKREITLGRYGQITLDQARKLARMRQGEILQGADPQAEKQKALRGETVADLCDAYIERHAEVRKKSLRDDKRMAEVLKKKWGTRRIDAITGADVARLHHDIGLKTKITANRTLALVSNMWNKARMWGYLPLTHPNPAEGVERFAETKRDRFVTRNEMPKLAEAIETEENVFARAAIWMYLLTGLRKSELLRLRWVPKSANDKDQEPWVDFAEGVIRLPNTKAGRPHYLPLSAAARRVLEEMPRLVSNPYVFCGKRKKRHLVNISKPWDRVRTKAEITDVRLHDLRRTVGSWLVQSGHSLALIGRVLNHSNTSTTQIYARFDLEPVQKALDDHGKLLEAAISPQRSGTGSP